LLGEDTVFTDGLLALVFWITCVINYYNLFLHWLWSILLVIFNSKKNRLPEEIVCKEVYYNLSMKEIMIRKTVPILTFIILLISLSACQLSWPDKPPDLGFNFDSSRLNTEIKIILPNEGNSRKIGDVVYLEIDNLSSYDWILNAKEDIKIFYVQDSKWQMTLDKMIDIGTTEINLKPKGVFPGDIQGIAINPDIKINHNVNLRIYVIAHRQNMNESQVLITGAYIDLVLSP
jgi:hypothetical protein